MILVNIESHSVKMLTAASTGLTLETWMGAMEVVLIPSQTSPKADPSLEPAPPVVLALLPWKHVLSCGPASKLPCKKRWKEEYYLGLLILIPLLFPAQVGVWHLSKEAYTMKLGSEV